MSLLVIVWAVFTGHPFVAIALVLSYLYQYTI